MTNKLVELARKAGDSIMEHYHEGIDIERKEDDSPLTQADLAAHRIIMEGLQELTPDIPIISEEGEIAGYEVRKEWTQFWLVDPLDGTKEFIKRNGEFTVNIALIEADKPVLGVVHLPAKDVTYSGSREEGAFRYTNSAEKPEPIHSQIPDTSKPLRVIASRSHGDSNLEQVLAEKGITIGETILAGSSLKFCRVAEGSADLYPRLKPTKEWDTAAGDAVFRYSGKEEERTSPLTYNKKSLLNDGFMIGL